jgi:hypothetical protein
MTKDNELVASADMIAKVAREASRLGVPLTLEQIESVAGSVDALKVSAARLRSQERNDEPAFGFRSPPSPHKEP